MSDWEPKPYRRRAHNRIWYGSPTTGWFVNYWGDELYGNFKTWQEAMEFLHDELAETSPMEVS